MSPVHISAIIIVTMALKLTHCQSADDIAISSVPSPPLFSLNNFISITCIYNTQKYRFHHFVHPIAGQISSSHDNYSVRISGGQASLQVSSATANDQGVYYCIFNLISGGSETVFNTIELEYREVAVINTPFTRYEAFVGEDQTLLCDVSHARTIQWLKSGIVLPDSSPDGRVKMINGNLVIRDVVLEDTARYTCQITNAISLVNVDAELKVILRPSAQASPESLKVDEADRAVFKCNISGSPLPSARWINVSSGLEITHSDYTQTDLMSSTKFQITLIFSQVALEHIGTYKCMATSSYGEAESRVILNLIGSLGAIQDVILQLVNQTNILVVWSAPVDDTVISYTVTIQSLNKSLIDISRSYMLDDSNPPSTSLLITGLEALTMYGVFVYATNERGRGVDSEQVNITTDAIAPDGEVQLTLFDLGPNSVKIECNLSRVDDGGSPVTMLRLLYSEIDGIWERVTVNSLSGNITELKPETNYQLRAQPGNRIGFGPPSDPISFTTSPEGYPGTPSHLSATSSTSESVLVCFDPSSVGDPFDSYDVWIEEVGLATEETSRITISASDLAESLPNCTVGVRVTSLAVATCYRFTMAVSNAQGTGQSSLLSNEVCTLEAVVNTEPTVDTVSNAVSLPVIAASAVVGTLFALTVLVLVVLCFCCCLKMRQTHKFNSTLPESRESSRSDAALVQFQTQTSIGNASVLTASSYNEDTPDTAMTQFSNENPFTFPVENSGRVFHTDPNLVVPSNAHQLHSRSTHSLPHYNPQHTHFVPLSGGVSSNDQQYCEMIDNPYYRRVRVPKAHENPGYYVEATELPPPPYHLGDIVEAGGSEVLSIQPPAFGESYSQPSYSPKLTHNSHKYRPNPSHNSSQLKTKDGISGVINTGGETDGTDFIDNNAYEMIPSRMERDHRNDNGREHLRDVPELEETQPRFEIKSQEPGAVFETVQFKRD